MLGATAWGVFPAVVIVGLCAAVLGVYAQTSGWWRRRRKARERVVAEDALKHLYTCASGDATATPESLSAVLHRSTTATLGITARLEGQGLIRSTPDALSLTAKGSRLALEVIRAHRLWERYLVDEARMPLVNVHAEAERREHELSGEALDAFDAALGYPSIDPHGDPIPTARGELAKIPAKPITDWPLDTPARVVHLEDEPGAVFAQIVAEGFYLGQIIRVVDSDARRIVLTDGEETYILAPIVAANIFVEPSAERVEAVPARRLASLRPGQSATIRGLEDTLQGFTRRRLLDLGLTPGTPITAEMWSLGRDPVAYRVRGSLIALRREQAAQVLIHPNGKDRKDGT